MDLALVIYNRAEISISISVLKKKNIFFDILSIDNYTDNYYYIYILRR